MVMEQSLKEFKESFIDNILAFLWNQWSALGIAGYAESNDVWYIDPEALLIFSLDLARHDARLFDEIIDWININGNLINIQRLKAMIKRKPSFDKRALFAISEIISKRRKFLKWKGLVNTPVKYETTNSLFFFKDGKPMGKFGPGEETFEKYGLYRGKLKLRGYSRPVKIHFNTGFLFKLRALFGVNARCEIILYLLTHESAHPSKIAEETFFSQKNIQDTLVEMLQSGLIFVQSIGKEKHYWLKKEKWFSFFEIDLVKPIQWINWHLLFNGLEQIWIKINEDNFINHNKLLVSSLFRELMHNIKPGIEKAGFKELLTDDKLYTGESYLPVFISDINRLLNKLTKS